MAALEQYHGIGRRKEAVARVYLRPGKGKFVVNGVDFKQYFGNLPRHEALMRGALRDAQVVSKYDIIVNVEGGGITGQAGAIRMGIARALLQAQPQLRPVVKAGGHLTRDPRIVERKKPGLHKARKASQYSKR